MSALDIGFEPPAVAALPNLGSTLSELSTVSLPVLAQSADLQVRRDRKYILAPAVISDVIAGRRAELCVLDIGHRQAFAYESVYFDTPSFDSYRSSAHGRRHRFKVRTRTYLDSAECVLELKLLGSRGETVKRRLCYRIDSRQRLNGAARAYLECNGLSPAIIKTLIPTLTTSYHRSTLLDADGSRYTIDVGLDCVGPHGRRASAGEMYILETKSPGVATPLDRLLWARGQRPVAVSKYCTGLAAVTPGLPANKWNRTLRSHYGWQPTGE
ncbi:MAG: polyphosphate polymerase domain-containing protein [Nakamurella sp.]